MSKLHTADLYTRVLELQHQLDTQRGEIKKVKAQHKKMRKHFTTMESLYGILDLLENFKYENSGEATSDGVELGTGAATRWHRLG